MSQAADDATFACADCRKRFADERGLHTHRRWTHDNPRWVAGKEAKKAFIAQKPIPTCPRCGRQARIDHTQFGPRAACCGLHSWGMKPLRDRTQKAAE